MKLKTLTLITAATLAIWPLTAGAFYNGTGDWGSLDLRCATDVQGYYMGDNGPRLLYPESAYGQAIENIRLLMDGDFADLIKLNVNVYQNLTAVTDFNYFFFTPGMDSYQTSYLSHTWGSGKITGSIFTDQLSLMFYTNRVDTTIGRQPVNFANNLIFVPNDVFHPFAYGAVDTTFRPGVDAARADIRLAQLAKLTFIGVLGYHDGSITWPQSAVMAHASVNAAGFDWIVLGGKIRNSYLVGAAFSGELWELGVRFEGNVQIPETSQPSYVQAAFGVDHKWPDSLHLIAEYYYHGNGTMDPSKYLNRMREQDLSVDSLLGIHYLGVALMGDALPTLKLQAFVLANLTDPSASFIPGIIYNAADEVDLMLMGNIPIGRIPTVQYNTPIPDVQFNSEFGAYPYSFSVLTRVYF